jgi:hypothetical protein
VARVAYTRTRDWATVDYYATLGVAADASDDDIARAFRSLAKQLHPDAGVPVEVAEQFKEVTVAYEVLSNHRARHDYDAVREGLLPRPRGMFVDGPLPADGSAPRFRAGTPRPLSWTLRRAWLAVIGGVLVTIAGIGMVSFVVGLQHRDSVKRHGRVAVTATRVSTADPGVRIAFTTAKGDQVQVPAPPRVNPGVTGDTVRILYDPRNPRDVIADESLTARNVTLWIVVVKLLVGGPVFVVLGLRARRRLRRAIA